MRKELEMTLEDGSKKLLPFEANGATPILYKNAFGEDLLMKINAMDKDHFDTLFGAKLAYVMARQAEGKLTGLSFDDFIRFTGKFDGLSLFEDTDKFFTLYLGNRMSTAKPKKEDAQLTEKSTQESIS
jgi:hypothetical protein